MSGSIIKTVHVKLDITNHDRLRKISESLNLPMATYVKLILMNQLNGDGIDVVNDQNKEKKKSRTISNRR